jgi:glycosyltransferase involved in cell wall biosynthesis
LVTVVTPSFNQGRFIRATIESVLAQDYAHLQYLVMDGGSTDETLDILKSYGSRFEWVSESDRGQAHAINKGWQRGKGEVLAWLNSDDVWLPGAVSRAVRYLVEHPACGMVHGEADFVDEEGRVVRRYPTYPFSAERIREECTVCQPTAFIRRTALDRVGYLNESLHYCMDHEYWIRLSRSFAIGSLPDRLAQSRWHASCKTVKSRVASQREVLDMLHKQYGCVRLRPLGFASREFVEKAVSMAVPLRRFVILFGTCVQFLREMWRYNRHCGLSEMFGWPRELWIGMQRWWRRPASLSS